MCAHVCICMYMFVYVCISLYMFVCACDQPAHSGDSANKSASSSCTSRSLDHGSLLEHTDMKNKSSKRSRPTDHGALYRAAHIVTEQHELSRLSQAPIACKDNTSFASYGHTGSCITALGRLHASTATAPG